MFLDRMASNPSAFLEFPKFPIRMDHGSLRYFKFQLQTISSHPSRSSWHPEEIADLPGTPQRLRWWWFKRSCQPLTPCTDFHWNSIHDQLLSILRTQFGQMLFQLSTSHRNWCLLKLELFADPIWHFPLQTRPCRGHGTCKFGSCLGCIRGGKSWHRGSRGHVGFPPPGEMAAAWWAVSSFHLGRHVVELLVQLILKVHVIQSHSCVS